MARILFDHGVPAPLRKLIPAHSTATAYEMGWAALANGDLIAAAEVGFEVLVTTDQNFKYQQNLSTRRLAIVVLPTTSWPKLRGHAAEIADAIDQLTPGSYVELVLGGLA